MPTTITSVPTQVAGTKAKASEINTLISNFRGDLLPINTDTQTASNRTHDLGSIDHYWDNLFCQAIQIGITTTCATITADTVGGIQLNLPTTTGQYDFMIAGTTVASIDSTGLDVTGSIADDAITQNMLQNVNATTAVASAAIGQICQNNCASGTKTSNTLMVTCTIASTGRPIVIEIMPNNSTTGLAQVESGIGTADRGSGIQWKIQRNLSDWSPAYVTNLVQFHSLGAVPTDTQVQLLPTYYKMIDTNYGATSAVEYNFVVQPATSTSWFRFVNMRMYVYEL